MEEEQEIRDYLAAFAFEEEQHGGEEDEEDKEDSKEQAEAENPEPYSMSGEFHRWQIPAYDGELVGVFRLPDHPTGYPHCSLGIFRGRSACRVMAVRIGLWKG